MTDEKRKFLEKIKTEWCWRGWGSGNEDWLISELEAAWIRVAELEGEYGNYHDDYVRLQHRAEAAEAERDKLARRIKELEKLNDELRRIHRDVADAATDPARRE